MADATVIKRQRTTAKQGFTRKVNILMEIISSDADIQEINAAYDDVSDAWKSIESKHD